MSDYTPTTQQVEDGYTYDPEYEYHYPDDTGYHHANRAAFRRWLAARDAEVKAQALEEAAESLRVGIRGSRCNRSCHEADKFTLQMRARAIREGKG